jgi:hypothetical protein
VGLAGLAPNERGVLAHNHRGNRNSLSKFKSFQDSQTEQVSIQILNLNGSHHKIKI